MNRLILMMPLLASLVVCVPSLSNPQSDDTRNATSVVQNFWNAERKIHRHPKLKVDWDILEKRLSFPFTAIPVGPNFTGRTLIYRNKKEFEARFQNITNDLKEGLLGEAIEDISLPIISRMRVLGKTDKLVYVSYFYHPPGDKTPYELLTLLRKGKAGWRIAFSTVPWTGNDIGINTKTLSP